MAWPVGTLDALGAFGSLGALRTLYALLALGTLDLGVPLGAVHTIFAPILARLRAIFTAFLGAVGAELDANAMTLGVYAANAHAVKPEARGEHLGKLRALGRGKVAEVDVLDPGAQLAVWFSLDPDVDPAAQPHLPFHAVARKQRGDVAKKIAVRAQQQSSDFVGGQPRIPKLNLAHPPRHQIADFIEQGARVDRAIRIARHGKPDLRRALVPGLGQPVFLPQVVVSRLRDADRSRGKGQGSGRRCHDASSPHELSPVGKAAGPV